MITTVAKNALYSSSDASLFQLIEKKFMKGVDEDIAGLQLFLDAHNAESPWERYAWEKLDAVDSLLGICSKPVKPQEVGSTGDGLFHIAFKEGLFSKHSTLLRFHSSEEDCIEIRQLNKASRYKWMLASKLTWTQSRYATD